MKEEIINLIIMIANLDLSINSKEKLYYQTSKISCLAEQKEKTIKEVREYIKDKWEMELKDSMEDFLDHDELVDRKRLLHILEILDKVSDKE